ncbi:3-oxo-5-alpha-steroid 4-dehydrogenase family protein [Coccidioides immitis RMSCC 3703]|uniref:3-oxo-5-alpha-steroid 4-dehydrogenase family protein n=1 Tax=Coccidioides immitis RMSCC 3703 TaxID=454286 RepID=A0A0J8QIX4_COCIT|nr:3-oxo-5-alpha-steroid 4-dehydrogenase family protein [Coccidioides immitis RMSCC 3703]
MDSLSTWIQSLPPPAEFFPPTPKAYSTLLSIFQYFPIITIAQWLLPFYPQGKTSLPTSILNFPGRYAWCFMESIGAMNMLYILYTHFQSIPNFLSTMPAWNKLLVALYILHYVNRAFITPLFLAPSMSPIHLIIIFTAVTYNYFNSSCLAGWLLGYGLPVSAYGEHIIATTTSAANTPIHAWLPYVPYIGIALYFLGMYGNIHAETTLFRLRREEAHRRQQKAKKDGDATNSRKSIYDKVYVIPPPTGVFRSILFPHYVLEWLEWAGFLLIGFAVASQTSHTPSASAKTPYIPLAPYYTPLAKLFLQRWGLPFPFPAIVFLVNTVLTTGARASWGRKWYAQRFGEKAVAARGGFVPYFKWL